MMIEILESGELIHSIHVPLKSDTNRFLEWEDRAKARIQEVEDHIRNVRENVIPYMKNGRYEIGLVFESKLVI